MSTLNADFKNIHPDSLVSIVGKPSEPYELSGSGNPITLVKAFDERYSNKWTANFKSVCGWNVADESKIQFYGSGEAEFIAARKKWIQDLGADLSDQGY